MTTISEQVASHLTELEIARSPESVNLSMPEVGPDDHAILDVGCGVGQTEVIRKYGFSSELAYCKTTAEARARREA